MIEDYLRECCKDNPNQPRDAHGRWTRDNDAARAAAIMGGLGTPGLTEKDHARMQEIKARANNPREANEKIHAHLWQKFRDFLTGILPQIH